MTICAAPAPRTPARPCGSSASRGSRNHHTSIGAPKLLGCRPISRRSVDERPSHATVSGACISRISPSAPRKRTPTTFCACTIGPSTSVLRSSRNVGSFSAAAASSSRKSHCGTSAMCLCGPGIRPRSMFTSVPWMLMVRVSISRCGIRANSDANPSSSSRRRVLACTVSPRKSRRKSACFSMTVTSTPARASSSPSMIPAGPPPATMQVVFSSSAGTRPSSQINLKSNAVLPVRAAPV